ncbi:MAG: shikimate kinase [Candidatus Binatia bacterium]
MAVGKSAVGRNLARRLQRRFVDLDRLIEKAEGKKVREIFAAKGEAYFRHLEKRTLQEVLQQQGQVIATGGGVIMDDENLNLLRQQTTLIGLVASIDTLLARAGNASKRPLLKSGDRRGRVGELMRQRETRYGQAHFTVDTNSLTMAQVVDKIIDRLNAENDPHANVDR